MKFIPFLAGCCLLLAFHSPDINNPITPAHADTSHAVHILDGMINEWPASKFTLSPDSMVEYAEDNDGKYFYIAMSIPDYGMQLKLMRNGMKIFIDTKNKKKEGKGIEFPVKGEVNAVTLDNPTTPDNREKETDPSKREKDRRVTRNIMALSVNSLKLFGFSDQQPEQGLIMPGSVNIAFKWDSLDVMHIEYNIPLELLGELSSLDQKEISIGWKINGFERPAMGSHSPENSGEFGQGGGGFSRGGGRMGGGGRGGYGGARGFNGAGRQGTTRHINVEEMGKEQNFWTKYTITLSANKKAF